MICIDSSDEDIDEVPMRSKKFVLYYACPFSDCSESAKMNQWGNLMIHVDRHLYSPLEFFYYCPAHPNIKDEDLEHWHNAGCSMECPQHIPKAFKEASGFYRHMKKYHGYKGRTSVAKSRNSHGTNKRFNWSTCWVPTETAQNSAPQHISTPNHEVSNLQRQLVSNTTNQPKTIILVNDSPSAHTQAFQEPTHAPQIAMRPSKEWSEQPPTYATTGRELAQRPGPQHTSASNHEVTGPGHSPCWLRAPSR